MNNAQQAEDAKNEGAIGGKLFIRDINRQESQQMQQFCEFVLKEGKTETPIMWKCAKAWLEYLSDKRQEAQKDIEAAMQLEGTDRMKDNARVLKFYITAATAKPSDEFDKYLTEELTWLKEKKEQDAFFGRSLGRIIRQIIAPHYQNRPEQQLALLLATGSYEYEYRIDTMHVDRLEKFYNYTKTPATKPFDRYLKSLINVNDTALVELIGTKYMRIAQWDKAIQWLKNIPAKFYNDHCNQEYLYYARMRSYEVEPWIKRQWLDSNKAWESEQKWEKNIKLDFCKEMQAMESSLNLLKGKALGQRYYALAVRYAQASIKGDCWWLLKQAKSCCDSVGVNESDFGAKAVELLKKAAMTTDTELKAKALFGMGYQELYNATRGSRLWTANEWDDQASDFVRKYYRQSPQFRAYQGLYELLKNVTNEPEYITKCDEFKQFRDYYQKHK